MAWCPQCKNEYKEGIKTCVDCGCDLVEQEQYDDLVPILFGDEEAKLEQLKKYLEYNNLQGVTLQYDEVERQYELFVREADKMQAVTMARVFLQQEALRELEEAEDMESEEMEEAESEEIEIQVRKENSGLYSSTTERAQENRTAAWTQLIVGGLGLLVMILGFLGVIPLKIGNPYMFYGVMGSLFLFFVVMGFVSMRSAKALAKTAESENSLKDAINAWYQQNLTAESVDAELGEDKDLPEEMLYFKRTQIIKDKLNHQFMNLDQVFLDHMIDNEIYDYIYTEKER